MANAQKKIDKQTDPSKKDWKEKSLQSHGMQVRPLAGKPIPIPRNVTPMLRPNPQPDPT
jgi:hypothetical protein